MRSFWTVVIATACAGTPCPKPAAPVAPAGARGRSEPETPPADYVEMRALRVVGTSVGDAVLLIDQDEEVLLPIFIAGTEASSIQLRLGKETFRRPLTHDLMDAALHQLDAKLVRVQVDDVVDEIFIGSVYVRDGERIFRLDARPSDAIALAVGAGVRIFVARRVLDRAGIRREELENPRVAPPGDGGLSLRRDPVEPRMALGGGR